MCTVRNLPTNVLYQSHFYSSVTTLPICDTYSSGLQLNGALYSELCRKRKFSSIATIVQHEVRYEIAASLL